jgi:hypothetical protein
MLTRPPLTEGAMWGNGIWWDEVAVPSQAGWGIAGRLAEPHIYQSGK